MDTGHASEGFIDAIYDALSTLSKGGDFSMASRDGTLHANPAAMSVGRCKYWLQRSGAFGPFEQKGQTTSLLNGHTCGADRDDVSMIGPAASAKNR